MLRQYCNECGADLDLIYMACPSCGSLNVVQVDDALPLHDRRLDSEEDFENLYNLCIIEGHDWRDIYDGECSQCVRCGVIDC